MTTPEQWPRIEAALDEILAMPESQWAAACRRIAGTDGALLRELESLLACVGAEDSILDRPLAASGGGARSSDYSLAAGARVGAYRIVAPIGRGGMGEVYRAERADGQFEQQVALKLMQRDAAEHSGRFQFERQTLARLEHPGIARLHDGGITADGRPFMVMELIDGRPILDWCREQRLDLARRLALFMAICDAVAFAHRNLVVHRDLKPDNVLVNRAGEIKLLDFGVAKWVGAERGDATVNAPLTPAYAAPEQLAHGAITTATDVYALGMLLFELLAGEPPWRLAELPLVAGLEKVLRETPPAVSEMAARRSAPPVPPALLRGDLDAIVAKALRKEPEHRYETVTALQTDIARFSKHEAVTPRSGARLYVFGRFARRHRLLIASATLVTAAVIAGVIGVLWQARRAEHEAARATAVKNFLVSIFRASDPRTASDQPRGQITAQALLDAGALRIDKEFSRDPDLEIDLLGTVESIYTLMNDGERALEVHRRRIALARAAYGDLNPIVIDSMQDEVAMDLRRVDLAAAQRRLDRIDALIRRAGLDRSALRARWWLQQGMILWSAPASPQQRTRAFSNAVLLYETADPHNDDLPVAWNELGQSQKIDGNYPAAIASFERAIAAAQREEVPDDSVQVTVDMNLALALTHQGERTRAAALLTSAVELAGKTYGADDRHYWEVAAALAQAIHEDGDRERALRMFDELLRRVPAEGGAYRSDSDRRLGARVRESYGAALASEGRPQLALPWLESAERVYTEIHRDDLDLPRVRRSLGDAYERVGRVDDARRALRASLDGQLAISPPDGEEALSARERWARFLLARGDLAGAEAELREVLSHARRRTLAPIALATADWARLELARHDVAAAAQARLAVEEFDHVEGFRDVRVGPYLWCTYAQALLHAGDAGGARLWAQKALDASVRYDAPDSASIADARALLAAASAAQPAA